MARRCRRRPPAWAKWTDGTYHSHCDLTKARARADSVRLHEYAAHILNSQAFADSPGRRYRPPPEAGFSGTAYYPKQTYRAPSHISKIVLSIVKIEPLKMVDHF